MEKVIYRNIAKKDYPAVRSLICDAFGLQRYVSDSKVLELVNKRYLCSSLAEQTYNQVAEMDGQVIGVIMGASSHATHQASHILNALRSLWYSLQIVLFHQKACHGQGNVHKVYGELVWDCKDQYDGVLTLFAVRENRRGLGIGKELLSGMQDYWKALGTGSSYLYTDDTCNFGFYEHMGFHRAKEKLVDIIRDGQNTKLDVYLYEYKTRSYAHPSEQKEYRSE